MRLSQLTLTGFRCFGTSTIIKFEELTALVGANGVGKTAILVALMRMFGATNAQRTLNKDDFYLPPTGNPTGTDLALSLDAIFEFSELSEDAAATASLAVPECLRHIMLTENAQIPKCRIMLRATWRQSASAEGDIEQELLWVNSTESSPPAETLHHLSSVERSLIQLFYVPATRDAVRELRAVSGTILSRSLQRVAWSDSTRENVLQGTQALADVVRSESALKNLEAGLRTHWKALCDHQAEPFFAFSDGDLPSILRNLDTRLERPDGNQGSLALLSEGERSLMYFALVQSALEFERKATMNGSAVATSVAPVLTLIAVEEPENHLAPQYLGKILASLRGTIGTGAAQVLVTSHSASLMRRVEPTEIRHLRVDAPGIHQVSHLTLPSDSDEAFKYVREAIRSYPELYFAKAIVLCEGPSEEVVMPHIARSFGLDIDPRFVAVVPLGGRHVNHFWRLLRTLRIPHVTVLDLDLGRSGGDWERIHYVMQQLLTLGETKVEVLGSMTEQAFAALPSANYPDHDDKDLAARVDYLENRFGIFFSTPLDIDFLLFQAYETQYRKLAPASGGPRIPTTEPARTERLRAAVHAVLGDDGCDGSSYPIDAQENFPWYSYLFLSRSKPATHAAVFAEIDDAEIRSACPSVLSRLVAQLKKLTST